MFQTLFNTIIKVYHSLTAFTPFNLINDFTPFNLINDLLRLKVSLI